MINFGLDALSAVRQLYNCGATPRLTVILSWSSGVEEMVQLDGKMRQNMYVGTNYYYTVDTPVAKNFVELYKKKTKKDLPPGYAPGAGYAMTRLILIGMEKAKSNEVPDVIKALEGFTTKGLGGDLHILAS